MLEFAGGEKSEGRFFRFSNLRLRQGCFIDGHRRAAMARTGLSSDECGELIVAGNTHEVIRIRMEAYDHSVLDQSAREIVDTVKRTHSEVHGPIPLPTRIERYTVLAGPTIDKKARSQFEIRTHKRLIDIVQATAKTIEALNKISLPAGVEIKIKATSK